MIFDVYRMMIIKDENLDSKFIYKTKKYQITIVLLLSNYLRFYLLLYSEQREILDTLQDQHSIINFRLLFSEFLFLRITYQVTQAGV
ncbi:unnamed protein product [Paramecium sonneborni]|uniref:Uncharacterized protein n=1 Tax=Paramecium sonneborni TaxID=65129 RepID=A0A8S1RRJ6_9CILI|nr:unnamed protein product [Paramecium sonneborni]